MKQGQFDLVASLTKVGMKNAEAVKFVKTTFDLIKEGVENDGIVKVKNLGTFKVIDIEQRESVDVNNGNKITLPGYKKLKFIPEPSLKQAVNEQYSELKVEYRSHDSWFDRFKKKFLK